MSNYDYQLFMSKIIKDKFRVELWISTSRRDTGTSKVQITSAEGWHVVMTYTEYDSIDVGRECYFATLYALNAVVS